MFNIIKESFSLTNKYIVLATPLIIFSLLSSVYLILSSGGRPTGLGIAFILFGLMLCAFLSGWFYMIKRILQDNIPDSADTLIAEFPSGVGEYFLSTLGLVFNTIIIFITIGVITYFAGIKFIGHIGITSTQLTNAMSSQENLKLFLNSLSDAQLLKLNAWNLLLFADMIFSYFILMFYAPTVIFKTKNPFVAFFVSIKDLFSRKFFKNIALFLLMFSSYFVLSVLTGLSGKNIFVHFFLTLVNFYYITYVAVLLFNYYYTNYAKIGSSIDTTV